MIQPNIRGAQQSKICALKFGHSSKNSQVTLFSLSFLKCRVSCLDEPIWSVINWIQPHLKNAQTKCFNGRNYEGDKKKMEYFLGILLFKTHVSKSCDVNAWTEQSNEEIWMERGHEWKEEKEIYFLTPCFTKKVWRIGVTASLKVIFFGKLLGRKNSWDWMEGFCSQWQGDLFFDSIPAEGIFQNPGAYVRQNSTDLHGHWRSKSTGSH